MGVIINESKESYDVRNAAGTIVKGVPKQMIEEIHADRERLQNLLRVGDVILISQGLGIIRYIGLVEGFTYCSADGETMGDDEEYIGVELKDSSKKKLQGLCDGSLNGKRYFDVARENAGLFIGFEDVRRVLTPEEILIQMAKLHTGLNDLRSEFRSLADPGHKTMLNQIKSK